MKTKPRILIFLPVWQRRQITRICYEGLKRIMHHASDRAEFIPLAIYSDEQDGELARNYGFKTFYSENKPLGRKFNNGMVYALSLAWDYVLQLNSDDVLSNELIDTFLGYVEENAPFVQVERLFMFEPATKRLKHYRYVDGCGVRMIRRDVIEKAGFCHKIRSRRSFTGMFINSSTLERVWNGYYPAIKVKERIHEQVTVQPIFNLWPSGINKGLDNLSRDKMALVISGSDCGICDGGRCRGTFGHMMREEKPLFVDIKSETNIWTYDSIKGDEIESGRDKEEALRPFPEVLEEFKSVGV